MVMEETAFSYCKMYGIRGRGERKWVDGETKTVSYFQEFEIERQKHRELVPAVRDRETKTP
jgi:hypothetical protein